MSMESTPSRASQRWHSAQARVQAPQAGGGPSSTTKTPLACATCRKKKVKCSGTLPCQYCQKRGLECVPRPIGSGRSYSVTSTRRIQELEHRLARYESSPASVAMATTQGTLKHGMNETSPVQNPHHSPSQASNLEAVVQSAAGVVPPNPTLSAPLGTSPNNANISTIATDSSLSSSNNFGSRIHTLLDHNTSDQQLNSSRINSTRATSIAKRSVVRKPGRRMNTTSPTLPSEERSHQLLEAVTFYIGQAQCHFDDRELLDRIYCLSQKHSSVNQLEAPEMLSTLLVLAIGKLFVGELDPGGGVPGSDLFEFVLGSFPTLGDLYALGRLGVELSALVAVYLQNSNQREEAYIYISTALRLAISHGFHRTSGLEKFVQSEKVRLNRLWWTVYMQERRLAAATGSPSGINDEAIELELPTNSPGFGPAAPLCTNIKIGRVIGQIINGLYGKDPHTEQAFVSNVQDIVQSLYDISQEIPSELDTSVRNSGSNLSLRTAAMLHLMLYQATLLTIRPIMLHVTQLILENNLPPGEHLSSTSIGKLTETCIEAARRMLKAIITLKKRDMIVIFGFFDLEAAFSAAIIMMLTTIYNSTRLDRERIHPTPGLNEALEVLQYLADKGNPFALQKLQETERLWELTQAHLQRLRSTGSNPGVVSGSGPNPTFSTSDDANMEDEVSLRDVSNYEEPSLNETPVMGGNGQTGPSMMEMITLDTSLWDNISTLWTLPHDNESTDLQPGTSAPSAPAEDSYRYYYSLYHNTQGPLIGEDMEDLTELGRYLANFGSN